MTQENSAKVSFILVVFLGMLTAITPLATDLYLPALPIMPGELNTTASNIQMTDRKSTRLNSSHIQKSRMPSSA